MARDLRSQRAIGEFLIDYASDVAKVQALDCHYVRRSSLTHKDNTLKNSVIARFGNIKNMNHCTALQVFQ